MPLAARWNKSGSSHERFWARGRTCHVDWSRNDLIAKVRGILPVAFFLMPHSIRLRGPWEYQPLVRFAPLASGHLHQTTEDLPAGGTAHLPADWGDLLGSDYQGVVRFTRRFHRPTGLDAASRVWLVIDDVDWHADVAVNEQTLGSAVCRLAAEPAAMRCPRRFDIRAGLLPENLLSLTVSSPQLSGDSVPLPRPGREGQPGGVIGLVVLEIE